MLDIRLPELRTMIYDQTKELLKPLGYRGNKNEMMFTQREKIKETIIAFGFSGYYPIDYQFNFGCTITYPLLFKVVSDFYHIVDPSRRAKWNASLHEGQFVDGLANASAKKKRGYYHSVASKQFAEIFIKQSLDTLANKVLPFIERLKDLEHFQDFVINNIFFLKENFEEREFLVSALLAVKMEDEKKFAELILIMEKLLFEEKQKGRNYKEHIFYLEKLKDYSFHYS